MFSYTNCALTHTISQIDYIHAWANSIYRAKKVEGVLTCMLTFYKRQMDHYLKYCEAQIFDHLSQITSTVIRAYLLWQEESLPNLGGLDAAYWVLKTLLWWYEFEAELEGWHNPISKVKAPRLTEEPHEAVELLDDQRMATSCNTSFLGRCDKAIQ
jgi:hypothetical protein